MKQSWALIVDIYRQLNASKLFWITLILSAFFIISFGLIGADQNNLKILWFHFDMPMASYFYRQIFSYIVAGFWLTWVATILALISTSGIFPDFLAGGAVEMYLSRPISRWRLFLTKYLAGMMFVLAQLLVFCIGSFLVFRIRAGEWRPSLFLAVPLVLCFFSYLFSIATLLGVATRSTLAALLLTLLCWGFFFSLQLTEKQLLKQVFFKEQYATDFDRDAAAAQLRLAHLESDPIATTQPYTQNIRDQRDKALAQAADLRHDELMWNRAHLMFRWVYLAMPKTTETTDLLDRWLFNQGEIEEVATQQESNLAMFFKDPEFRRRQMADVRSTAQLQRELRLRRPAWVIGTSLGFEAVVLLIAGWIFCRRDY